MNELKETINKLENSRNDLERKRIITFLDPEFVTKQEEILKKYRKKLDYYNDPKFKKALQTFGYTGDRKLRIYDIDIDYFFSNLRDIYNQLEPLKKDIIVYVNADNFIGASLTGKIVKFTNKFHPLAGTINNPLKLFSEYKEDEPNDYIIRCLTFTDSTLDIPQEANNILALRIPSNTYHIMLSSLLRNREFTQQSTITLFPDITFVLYEKIIGKNGKTFYTGVLCEKLESLPWIVYPLSRFYIDDNFVTNTIFSRKIDDQKDHGRPFMYHEEKSYEKNVIYAFPQITSRTKIPPKFRGNSLKDINAELRSAIINGRGKHWTNQQLSYMRKELFSQAIFNEIRSRFDKDERIHIVDATGNIGGDSLLFALQPEVSWVLTYEMNPDTFKLLENNIDLYGLNQGVVPINERFSATEQKIFRGAYIANTVVIIDPPYEYPPGAENERFVYSIDKLPLIYMIGDCLTAGAEMVVVSVPLDFTFSRDFAEENGISVDCYTMGKKDMKIYIAWKSSKPNFHSDIIKMPRPN